MLKTIIGKYKSRKFAARLSQMQQQQEIEQAAKALRQRMESLLTKKLPQATDPQIAV